MDTRKNHAAAKGREGTGPVANPIRLLAELETGPPKPRGSARIGLAKRIAAFEAQRAQEERTMAPGIQVQDLNPTAHQTKATFTPMKTGIPPRPPNAAVQRVSGEPEPVETGPDMFTEMEAEFAAEAAPATAAAPIQATESLEPDVDIDNILNRFKGTTEEKLKQLAKSYGHSEKRQRQLEQEKQLLMKQPSAQAAAPVAQQVQITPQFDYKKWGDTFLDRPDERVKELEQHIQARVEQKMVEVAGPLYEEAIDNRLFRKYGDIVTEENVDVIKAMAQNEPGANRWEQMVHAVQKYRTAMPQTAPAQNREVQQMIQSAQSPTPQARQSGEKKMWKESDIRATMQKKIKNGDYQRDPRWRNLIDTAYREDRVIRGQ